MNNPKIPVILASQSPRRIELLKTVIENFRVVPSKIDEICDTDLSPEENAILLGRKKATWVAIPSSFCFAVVGCISYFSPH